MNIEYISNFVKSWGLSKFIEHMKKQKEINVMNCDYYIDRQVKPITGKDLRYVRLKTEFNTLNVFQDGSVEYVEENTMEELWKNFGKEENIARSKGINYYNKWCEPIDKVMCDMIFGK